jgi:hypothetical protein
MSFLRNRLQFILIVRRGGGFIVRLVHFKRQISKRGNVKVPDKLLESASPAITEPFDHGSQVSLISRRTLRECFRQFVHQHIEVSHGAEVLGELG